MDGHHADLVAVGIFDLGLADERRRTGCGRTPARCAEACSPVPTNCSQPAQIVLVALLAASVCAQPYIVRP